MRPARQSSRRSQVDISHVAYGVRATVCGARENKNDKTTECSMLKVNIRWCFISLSLHPSTVDSADDAFRTKTTATTLFAVCPSPTDRPMGANRVKIGNEQTERRKIEQT